MKRFLPVLLTTIILSLYGMNPVYGEEVPEDSRTVMDFGVKTHNLGGFPRAAAVTDIDSDGDPDIVVTNPKNNNILLLLNKGDGRFEPGDSYPVEGYPIALIAEDLDGDTDIDLAVLDSDGSVQVFRQEGEGKGQGGGRPTFSPAGSYKVPDYSFSISSSDLDSDRDTDLIILSAKATTILLNDGKGSFNTILTYKGDANSNPGLTVDLNSDEMNDMVIGDREGISVVLLNNGDGTFPAGIYYATGEMPVSIVAGDMDSDLDLDLVTANYKAHTISILRNNGDGTFKDAVNYPAEKGPSSLTLSDIDSDEDLDIIVTNGLSGGLSIFINNTVRPLSIITNDLPQGRKGDYYSAKIEAMGGVPPYNWAIVSGSLPPSLHLDSTTGEIFSLSKNGHDDEDEGVKEAGDGDESNHEGHDMGEPLLSAGPPCYCLNAPLGLYRFTARVTDSTSNTATAADLYIEVLPKPGTVSGTIRYSGEKKGMIRIGLWAQPQSAPMVLFLRPIYSAGITATGEYKIDNIYPAAYHIAAFLDVNGDGTRQADEPYGTFGSTGKPEPIVVDNGAEVEGIDIELMEK